jgi:hypothetical protein
MIKCDNYMEESGWPAPFQSRHSEFSKPGQLEKFVYKFTFRLFNVVSSSHRLCRTYFKIVIFGR